MYSLSLDIDFPNDVKKGDEYTLTAYQTGERNEPIGGASVVYRIK